MITEHSNQGCACGDRHHGEKVSGSEALGQVGVQDASSAESFGERIENRKEKATKGGEEDGEPPHHPVHGKSCCSHERNEVSQGASCACSSDVAPTRHHAGEGDGCCGHGHGATVHPDPSIPGRASATRAVYRIMNMDCPMEEALVRKKLEGMAGVTGLEFNLVQRVLVVDHALSSTRPIERALESIKMKPEAILADQESEKIPETHIPWKKFAVACLFAFFAEFAELVSEYGKGAAFLEWLSLGCAVVAISLGGFSTFKKGWIAIRTFNLNINALMAVAVTGAVLVGQYPEAAMVMVLFALSEAIEAKSMDRVRRAIGNLLDLAPETAMVLKDDGTWEEMNSRKVGIGSRVRVRPGERIALDGILVQGRSTVNQAPITGESFSLVKNAGDAVFAGTINESGSFEFTVTAAATNSTLSRIIHSVEEAQASRAPIQRFVDSFAKVYTPLVFLTAIFVAVIPPLFFGASWKEWVYTGLVLLVIGCPCALVISTPVSIVSAMAAATRHGILIKGGAYLEQGRLLAWLALDKTGTLTHGKPVLTHFVNVSGAGDDEILRIAASLAVRSDHPVSCAIAKRAREEGLSPLDVKDFAAIPGQGVTGSIGNASWQLGNHRMVDELGKGSENLEEKIFSLEKQGKSVVVLIGAEGAAGLFAVADTLKESSIVAVRELKKLGIRTMMLTGDNEYTARAIAEEAGVDDFRDSLLPEDKLRLVEQLGEAGKVGMVGDGINDAPALAKADIGFAMGAMGTDTAIETADVALMDDDLRKIPRFIRLSRSTHAILMQNITLALGVKAVFFGLAFAGLATMWMAVFADVGTSLLVVANGLRAIRK